MTQKATIEWDKRRLGNRSMVLFKLLCHLGCRTQKIQWCLKCQWQIGMLFGAFGRSLEVNCSTCSQDFVAKTCHLQYITTPLLRKLFICYWALVETEHLTMCPQVTCD